MSVAAQFDITQIGDRIQSEVNRAIQRSIKGVEYFSTSGPTLGLTPKDHSTGGKTRLGVITKAGDEQLRAALVAGATALIQHVRTGRCKSASPWLKALVARKPPKLAAVALANKTARIAWKLMVTGERYRPAQATPLAKAA